MRPNGSLGLLRHQRVVDLPRPHGRRAVHEAADIALESGALLERAELHPPAEMRRDVEVGGGETVAHEVAVRYGAFERVEHGLHGAEAGHALAFLRNAEAEGLAQRRRLDRAGAE